MIKLKSWLISAWKAKVSASAICTSAISLVHNQTEQNNNGNLKKKGEQRKLRVLYFALYNRELIGFQKNEFEGIYILNEVLLVPSSQRILS